ncbi:hypothetical protein T11_6919 [Trichinella zimbabwensis]|uniref:Uncharacterized protein n=1 Tax=Trichinella zimbabwensis TaxID=268475 RepID=A0A0V1H707_9BILA|nr:hypothetical protein T11_6919 [Trichinella zimbabwensis]
MLEITTANAYYDIFSMNCEILFAMPKKCRSYFNANLYSYLYHITIRKLYDASTHKVAKKDCRCFLYAFAKWRLHHNFSALLYHMLHFVFFFLWEGEFQKEEINDLFIIKMLLLYKNGMLNMKNKINISSIMLSALTTDLHRFLSAGTNTNTNIKFIPFPHLTILCNFISCLQTETNRVKYNTVSIIYSFKEVSMKSAWSCSNRQISFQAASFGKAVLHYWCLSQENPTTATTTTNIYDCDAIFDSRNTMLLTVMIMFEDNTFEQ